MLNEVCETADGRSKLLIKHGDTRHISNRGDVKMGAWQLFGLCG